MGKMGKTRTKTSVAMIIMDVDGMIRGVYQSE